MNNNVTIVLNKFSYLYYYVKLRFKEFEKLIKETAYLVVLRLLGHAQNYCPLCYWIIADS